ncbi:MAG: N-acetylmuramoyl-L-alanine amidase [Acetobacteraceae bacterium]|jgi:N-acetylmuramoyl-L-alanine amidase|nr:N-acetylmuramoyl-L-alanine amidase [Acetobacteraceae bacterium]
MEPHQEGARPLIEAPSPNHDARPEGAVIDTLVLHYTGMQTGEAAIARLREPEAKVSSHYVVEEDGRVFSLVPEERRAWHAGLSWWRGRPMLNDRSIGIEIVNPGHEWGYRDFPPAQIASVITLCQGILARRPIPPRNVVAHSDIAPERKQDPGERFPWATLAEAGIGLWPGPAPDEARALPPLSIGDEGAGVRSLRATLRRLGFRLAEEGAYDRGLAIAVIAFQRHWAPHRTDGVADGETRWRAGRVLGLAEGRVRPPHAGVA